MQGWLSAEVWFEKFNTQTFCIDDSLTYFDIVDDVDESCPVLDIVDKCFLVESCSVLDFIKV